MTPHERTEAHYLKVAQKLKAEAGAKAPSTAEHHKREPSALLECCSKIERIPMIEIRQIVDDIRQRSVNFPPLQTSGKPQSVRLKRPAQAVVEISDKMERLHLSERPFPRLGSDCTQWQTGR
jgi:hypothetical protein